MDIGSAAGCVAQSRTVLSEAAGLLGAAAAAVWSDDAAALYEKERAALVAQCRQLDRDLERARQALLACAAEQAALRRLLGAG